MNNNYIKGIIILILYFVLSFSTALPLYLLNININSLSILAKSIYLIIYDLISIGIIFFILKKQIIENIKELKIKYKLFFKNYFLYWFLLLFLMISSNIIIQAIYPNSIAGNEESFRKIFMIAPIYSFIKASLLSPIMEELVFRMGIRNIFKNKYIFILASGTIFGLLHVIGNVNNPYDYLYLIPYSLPGFILAYVYYKSDNIFTSLFIHFIHNTFLLILQIIG